MKQIGHCTWWENFQTLLISVHISFLLDSIHLSASPSFLSSLSSTPPSLLPCLLSIPPPLLSCLHSTLPSLSSLHFSNILSYFPFVPFSLLSSLHFTFLSFLPPHPSFHPSIAPQPSLLHSHPTASPFTHKFPPVVSVPALTQLTAPIILLPQLRKCVLP